MNENALQRILVLGLELHEGICFPANTREKEKTDFIKHNHKMGSVFESYCMAIRLTHGDTVARAWVRILFNNLLQIAYTETVDRNNHVNASFETQMRQQDVCSEGMWELAQVLDGVQPVYQKTKQLPGGGWEVTVSCVYNGTTYDGNATRERVEDARALASGKMLLKLRLPVTVSSDLSLHVPQLTRATGRAQSPLLNGFPTRIHVTSFWFRFVW